MTGALGIIVIMTTELVPHYVAAPLHDSGPIRLPITAVYSKHVPLISRETKNRSSSTQIHYPPRKRTQQNEGVP